MIFVCFGAYIHAFHLLLWWVLAQIRYHTEIPLEMGVINQSVSSPASAIFGSVLKGGV